MQIRNVKSSICNKECKRFSSNGDLKNVILYFGIYSHLIYGIILWGSTYKVHVNKLIIMQKKDNTVITVPYWGSLQRTLRSLICSTTNYKIRRHLCARSIQIYVLVQS